MWKHDIQIQTEKQIMADLKETIEAAWLDRSLLQGWETKKVIREVIELLDKRRTPRSRAFARRSQKRRRKW
jgi:hypothetical protein